MPSIIIFVAAVLLDISSRSSLRSCCSAVAAVAELLRSSSTDRARPSCCVRKGARVYMCTQIPGISVSLSLSLSVCLLLSSLSEIRIIHGLFLECVSMSICESEISNLSRSVSFGRSATDRFDRTDYLKIKILDPQNYIRIP